MRVKEWMNPDPVYVDPDATVSNARQLMAANRFRHLLVVADGRVVGIVSDRDVNIDHKSLRRLEALERLGEAVGEFKLIETVMSSPVHYVGPDETLGNAARIMLTHKISALPVIEEDMNLVGIITTTDCLLAAIAEDPVLGNQPGILSQ